jgi:hypothetical protein
MMSSKGSDKEMTVLNQANEKLNDPNYDSGNQDYDDADLAALVGDNCEAALRNARAGYRLESDNEETCAIMWRMAIGCLSGQYERLMTNAQVDDPTPWKQIVLKNGSVLRIGAPEVRGKGN